jgi:chromosome segregation ATPase
MGPMGPMGPYMGPMGPHMGPMGPHMGHMGPHMGHMRPQMGPNAMNNLNRMFAGFRNTTSEYQSVPCAQQINTGESNDTNDSKKYEKLIGEMNDIQHMISLSDGDRLHIYNLNRQLDSLRSQIYMIDNKYTNLRNEVKNIKDQLNKLELEPTENAKQISNLVKQMSIVCNQIKEFDNRNGGGASKY